MKRESGVCVTFDDNYVYQWHSARELFSNYGVRATFFVSWFHELTDHQRLTLHDLCRYGHEVGYHTVNHPRASEFLSRFSLSDYIKNEVLPGVSLMKEHGFNPTAFCYPYSDRNEQLDQELLHHFKILRWGSSDPSFWFHPRSGNQVVCAGNLDLAVNPERSLEQVKIELQQARDQNSIVVYYAHRIGEGGISYAALEKICKAAKNLDLRFYTLSELAESTSNFSPQGLLSSGMTVF
jgi:peptidoglycan/xylan/chitin deacetylase (PgdA/CDA1 family)